MEIFKEIPGFEKYQVSNLWNVKSLDYKNTGKEKLLKPYVHNTWYVYVYFRKNNIKKGHSIHRLVLLSFYGKSKREINHKNGIKSDNRLENLEYCTRSDNLKHKYRELWYKNNFTEKRKKVKQYTRENIFIKEWESITEASKKLNIDIANISAVCRGKAKSTWGYLWKF